MPSQLLGNFVNRTTTSNGMTKILDSVSAFGRFNVCFPESVLRARSLSLAGRVERNRARRLLYPLDYIFALLHCQSTDEICCTRPSGETDAHFSMRDFIYKIAAHQRWSVAAAAVGLVVVVGVILFGIRILHNNPIQRPPQRA